MFLFIILSSIVPHFSKSKWNMGLFLVLKKFIGNNIERKNIKEEKGKSEVIFLYWLPIEKLGEEN